MNTERMILSDAIGAAIEANKTVIRQRKIIVILLLCLVASVGKRYGQKPY